MNQALNSGKGMCKGTAFLSILPSKAALEMDAAFDVVMGTLQAVHHINRHASLDDFIAVSLPFIHDHHTFGPGKQHPSSKLGVELLASETALETLTSCEGMISLKKRGGIAALHIASPMIDVGDVGVAFVRERARAKHLSPSEKRRSEKRVEKQKKWFEANKAEAAAIRYHPSKTKHNDSLLALHYGTSIITIKCVEGVVRPGPFEVTTYGYSSPVNPSFLPVIPLSENTDLAA